MSKIQAKFIDFGTGTGQVSARDVPANFTPTNYTPSQVGSEGTTKVSAHLKGIDALLAAASATVPGIVTTGTQTFAGDKTFNNNVSALGTITGSNLVIAANDPATTAINVAAGTFIYYPTTPQWYLKRDSGSTTNVYPLDLPIAGKPGNWSTGWKTTSGVTLSVVGGVGTGTVLRVTLSAPTVIFLIGRPITLAAADYDVTLSGGAGIRYIYFDDATGVLKSSTSFPNLATTAYTAIAWWSGTAIVNYGWELHGLRDTVWHIYTHLNYGMRFNSGMAQTSSVSTDNNVNPGATPTVETIWFGTGTLYDEDIAVTVGTAPWNNVVLGTALDFTNAASLPFYYYNGSTIVRVAPMADRTPFMYTGTNGTPERNNAGTMTAAVTGDYVVNWIYASSLLGADTLFIRPHNNTTAYTSLIDASAANDSSLNWSTFPAAEVKLLYRVISRVNTGWSSTHRSKIVQVDNYTTVAGSPVAAVSATNHNTLSNRTDANSHPATAVSTDTTWGGSAGADRLLNTEANVQLALNTLALYATGSIGGLVSTTTQTFAGNKTFSNNVTISGDLTVNGAKVYQNVETVQVKDNIMVLNYGETGSGITADYSGFMVDRGTATYDYAIVFKEATTSFNLGIFTMLTGFAGASTINTITLTGGYAINGHYVNNKVRITAGTGRGQVRNVSAYDGTTKIATVSSNWTTTPDGTSEFEILQDEGLQRIASYYGTTYAGGIMYYDSGAMKTNSDFMISDTAYLSAISFTSTLNTTGAIKIPVGTTSQQPVSPSTGHVRYNSTNNVLEYYDGNTTTWQNVSSETYADNAAKKWALVLG